MQCKSFPIRLEASLVIFQLKLQTIGDATQIYAERNRKPSLTYKNRATLFSFNSERQYMRKPRKEVKYTASKRWEMPSANQQQPELFIFVDSKQHWQHAPVRVKAGSELSLLGKRR